MVVGRSTEYGQLELLLRSAPRVTVVGPGGFGKSA
ncbi:ATP-binding protein, partial [Streptomyces sp. A7024]|nr:ATP-binding protein [Streptomyces coryli]